MDNHIIKALYRVLAFNTHSIGRELVREFFPDMPLPQIKVVNRVRANWLGRCESSWKNGERVKTTILIQKSIIDDETSLRRIMAHELIHAWEHYTVPYRQLKGGDGHGAFFQEWANTINRRYGADYVTETSDEAIVVKQIKKYNLVIRKLDKGFGANVFMRLTPKVQDRLKRLLQKGDTHIIRTDDARFSSAPALTSYKIATYQSEEYQKTLEEMFEGPNEDKKYL